MWPIDFFKNYFYAGFYVTPQIVNQFTAEFGNENTVFIQVDFLEVDIPLAELLLIKKC